VGGSPALMSQAVTESRNAMQRKFFVSYSTVSNHGGSFGFGNTVMTFDGRMTEQMFTVVSDYLNERYPDKNVIVLAFQELETAEEPASV
jgi:hypothetical protein